jgi:ribosomal protein L32
MHFPDHLAHDVITCPFCGVRPLVGDVCDYCGTGLGSRMRDGLGIHVGADLTNRTKEEDMNPAEENGVKALEEAPRNLER